MDDLPSIALSVRQPWAWAIIHGGKDIENRSWHAVNKGRLDRSVRIAVHAAKGMTRDEYEDALGFMRDVIGICPPPPALLARGGIIGSVIVARVVKKHDSPWFFGPRGLVLHSPRPCEFIPARGALGYFQWSPADPSIVPPPEKWMLPAEPNETIRSQAAFTFYDGD